MFVGRHGGCESDRRYRDAERFIYRYIYLLIDTKLYRVNGNRNGGIRLSFFRFGNKSPRESILQALPPKQTVCLEHKISDARDPPL